MSSPPGDEEMSEDDKIEGDELSHLEKKTLKALDDMNGSASPEEVKTEGDFKEEVQVMNAASWLESKDLITIDEDIKKYYSLKKKSVAKKDLPERKALKYIDKSGGRCPISDLKENSRLVKKEVNISLGWLKDKDWAKIVKVDGESCLEITKKGKKALKEKGRDEELIRRLGKEGELSDEKLDKYTVNKLLSRKELLDERKDVERTLALTDKGREIVKEGIEIKPEIAQLTPEMIRNRAWKDVVIRPYDVKAFAPSKYSGKRHPIKKEIEEVRRIFLEMGFEEIKYDFIQPALWNFDALFSPQDHPARDMQDTFYMQENFELDRGQEVIKKIKAMHENGGDTRSTGWGYDWSLEEARRAVLRTHTTVASIRHLAENPDPPVKAFSVDRNFRSETTDATHLPELIQIEGIVMEEEANLNMLIGMMKEFYSKMGFEDIKVRPGYFPFTEPSLEVFAKYKDDYMEMGGAGLFRREVLAPHGIDKPVIAWGLGLERLVMLRLGIDDIREFYRNDLEFLRDYPLI